jgi:tRNA nucleotidyltransferase (CCA-adding enzyme)
MRIYLVGGAVRDELLGLPVTERDYVVVGATERRMLDLGYRRLDKAFPVFSHPETGDEYALARRERKTGPGYKGFSVDAGPEVTLEQDLARRDLTVNALARNGSGEIIDLFRGRDDLDAGVLRHITPAFVEDPVRLLRLARFTAKLGRWGFRAAHGTFALMRSMARRDELETVLPDRLREEMYKALGTEQPWRFFETLHRCGALARLLPPVDRAMGEPDTHARGGESRSVIALKRAVGISEEPAVRFAALLVAAVQDPKEGAQLGRHLRLNRSSVELLGWVLEWPTEVVVQADAECLLRLIEQVKALHHPERLLRLSKVWSAVDDEQGTAASERVQWALQAAAAVDSGVIAGEGWSGLELGRKLRQRRLRSIKALL